jgi:hypothetical protein
LTTSGKDGGAMQQSPAIEADKLAFEFAQLQGLLHSVNAKYIHNA